MKGSTRVSLLAAASLWGALHASPGYSYEFVSAIAIDLGTMGGRSSEASDINDAGNIVGWSHSYAGVIHAFFYRAGHFVDVGASRWSTESRATSLNNSNVVVGNLSVNGRSLAFRWYEGALQELRVSVSPHARVGTTAHAISDAGFIVGTRDYRELHNFQLATVWTDDVTFHTLNVPGNDWGSGAYDINAAGEVVGHAGTDSFRWNFNPSVSPSRSVVIPSPRSDCDVQRAFGIARYNVVAGYVSCPPIGPDSHLRAFSWSGLSLVSRDLGLLPTGRRSVAYDVNDLSFVVGAADQRAPIPGTPGIYVAFIHHPDFGIRALPTLPGTTGHGECQAEALNNVNANGVIKVVGFCHTGDQDSPRHAVLWNVRVS